ncbi:MAG: hypothetical protein ACLR8Y_06740 [Alistipes indistinctus]
MKENLDYVVRNKIGSTSHHDITLDNHTRHYENRIFPLDDEHALCMCRDVTDQVIVQQELEQANLRMVTAEDIALLSHWYYYEDIKEFEAPKIIPWLVGGGDGKLTRCRKELFLSHVHPADRDALLNQLRYGQAGDAICRVPHFGAGADPLLPQPHSPDNQEGKTEAALSRVMRRI